MGNENDRTREVVLASFIGAREVLAETFIKYPGFGSILDTHKTAFSKVEENGLWKIADGDIIMSMVDGVSMQIKRGKEGGYSYVASDKFSNTAMFITHSRPDARDGDQIGEFLNFSGAALDGRSSGKLLYLISHEDGPSRYYANGYELINRVGEHSVWKAMSEERCQLYNIGSKDTSEEE